MPVIDVNTQPDPTDFLADILDALFSDGTETEQLLDKAALQFEPPAPELVEQASAQANSFVDGGISQAGLGGTAATNELPIPLVKPQIPGTIPAAPAIPAPKPPPTPVVPQTPGEEDALRQAALAAALGAFGGPQEEEQIPPLSAPGGSAGRVGQQFNLPQPSFQQFGQGIVPGAQQQDVTNTLAQLLRRGLV